MNIQYASLCVCACKPLFMCRCIYVFVMFECVQCVDFKALSRISLGISTDIRI